MTLTLPNLDVHEPEAFSVIQGSLEEGHGCRDSYVQKSIYTEVNTEVEIAVKLTETAII